MTSFNSVQRQKTKHSFEWLVLNWNVKLTYCHGNAEWFEARKSTQKRNNHLNPTFFAPRLTEEKERDEEFAQQLDKLLLMLLYVSTHSVGFRAIWAIVQNNGALTFSVLTFSVGFRRMSDDLKGLWRVNASPVEEQRHLHLYQVLKGTHSSICTCAVFSIFFYLSITHPAEAAGSRDATSLNYRWLKPRLLVKHGSTFCTVKCQWS